MHNLVLALAASAVLSTSALGANAAPLTAALYNDVQAPGIVLVAEGCGPGGHRNGFGRCVPNRIAPRVEHCVVRPTPNGPRRVCRF